MNENNEIMEMNEVNEEPEVIEEERSEMGTGLAMLIGAGLTIAAIAAVKKGRKVWAKIKAKKEAASETEESKVIETTCDVEEVETEK